MASQNAFNSLDIDRSPVCKRARYDVDPEDATRWTLSRNELILHSVYDSGVGCLGSDFEDIVGRDKQLSVESVYSNESPNGKSEQIAVLEASLPENTLHKLSLGELDNLLVRQNYEPKQNLGINYFNLLSDEVILHILQKLTKSQLSNVALVCRRFSQLIEDESLWTRMDVSNKILEKGTIGTILSRQVIILRLSRSRIHSPSILPNCKAFFPEFRSRLMYLDLSMTAIDTKALTSFLSKCKRLKKLSLESVPVNQEVLEVISDNRELEVLNLAMCEGITVSGLEPLMAHCRKIRELNLSWTYLNSSSIDYICDHLPSTLDRFNFSGCRKLLQDEHVGRLVLSCPNLRELDLSDCTSITGDAIKILDVLQELNFLALSRCYLVSFRSLLHLKKMKSLAYLDVHGSYINAEEYKLIHDGLGNNVNINKFKFSSIARPTVGLPKSSIWNMSVRD